MVIVVMGVSGSGKSTVGQLLAETLQLPFFDADDFHPEANTIKMAQGIPLNDQDRLPWLENLNHHIKSWDVQEGAVLACSALKQSYRDILERSVSIYWVYLEGSFTLIKERLDQRHNHFMSSQLLQSQFDALEAPKKAFKISIEESPEQVVKKIIKDLKNMNNAEIGLIGLGVMGKSIARNLLSRGCKLAVYNRVTAGEEKVVTNFINDYSNDDLHGFTNLEHFVNSLETPRKILCMIPAGSPLDDLIKAIDPYLEKGDILIDGGNSYFQDTQRRIDSLSEKGIQYLGVGISGGEQGALKGPSIMPGGQKEAYVQVAKYLESIAAKDDNGLACCTYIGPQGSGHFVKMIHNGIEYAEMQLLAECYTLLKPWHDNDEIAQIFEEWNSTTLSSYLLEITIEILRKKEDGSYLLDQILDKAGNKGTGCWSSKIALDLGMPTSIMTQAVFARYISAFKTKRSQLSTLIQWPKIEEQPIEVQDLKKAYQLSRVVNHQQGFELIQNASQTYDWELNLSEIARIWTNGCIIKSTLMVQCIHVLKSDNNLFNNKDLMEELQTNETALSSVLIKALKHRLFIPCFTEALNYWVGMTTERLSANVIQAQRDYFGAHTYQKNDGTDRFYHTNW